MGSTSASPRNGFTIVELLIVIIVIGILATLVLIGYQGVTGQAKDAKIKSDLNSLEKAIRAARIDTNKTLGQITGSYYTAGSCVGEPAGTDLASLSQTSSCWTAYNTAISNIAKAASIGLGTIKDPWGRPYFIDENEGENGGCIQDLIGVYAEPFSGASRMYQYDIKIDRTGVTGCPSP